MLQLNNAQQNIGHSGRLEYLIGIGCYVTCVRTQLYFSAKCGSRHRTDSFQLWSISSCTSGTISSYTSGQTSGTTSSCISGTTSGCTSDTTSAALPVLLPVALPVMISYFNIVKVGELLEFLFMFYRLPFVTLAFVKLAVRKTVHSLLNSKMHEQSSPCEKYMNLIAQCPVQRRHA